MKNKYLFIRILEACNSNCFMCGFRQSKDSYRFSLSEFKSMLPTLKKEGVGYIRFTGGEPLLHNDIVHMVAAAKDLSIKTSIITNGLLLGKKAQILAEAGLSQVIVSIDGMEKTHESVRRINGLFKACTKGLLASRENGIKLRVNSVVGPHNYKDMPTLQEYLTQIDVEQWEMSSLKLGKPLDYTEEDRKNIERVVIPKIFNVGSKKGYLVPFGKIWCGNTPKERATYFKTGITPTPDETCNIVDFVRYYDPKNNKLYACSLIPHREESEKRFLSEIPHASQLSTKGTKITEQAKFFKTHGPKRCTGCSSTAAGLSNQIHQGRKLHDWSY